MQSHTFLFTLLSQQFWHLIYFNTFKYPLNYAVDLLKGNFCVGSSATELLRGSVKLNIVKFAIVNSSVEFQAKNIQRKNPNKLELLNNVNNNHYGHYLLKKIVNFFIKKMCAFEK